MEKSINMDALKNTDWVMSVDTGHMTATKDTTQKLRDAGFPFLSMVTDNSGVNVNAEMVFGFASDMVAFIKNYNLHVDCSVLKTRLTEDMSVLDIIMRTQV